MQTKWRLLFINVDKNDYKCRHFYTLLNLIIPCHTNEQGIGLQVPQKQPELQGKPPGPVKYNWEPFVFWAGSFGKMYTKGSHNNQWLMLSQGVHLSESSHSIILRRIKYWHIPNSNHAFNCCVYQTTFKTVTKKEFTKVSNNFNFSII